MYNAKLVSITLTAYFELSLALCLELHDDIEYVSRVPYSSAVGSLMYAIVYSLPDLSHALSVVNRFMINLGKEHWRAI